jgi:glycosyltransferase involved in cell wall biosynthesis
MTRVLLLSPFAPVPGHGHAADDTVVGLVPRLAERVELLVYSPQHQGPQRTDLGYVPLPSTAARPPRLTDRLGLKPAWLRTVWPRAATAEALELVAQIKPDVVHAEYLQSAEAVTACGNTVLGLHDITEQVMRESWSASSWRQRPYRWAELVRTRRFERSSIRRAAAVTTLSEPDFAVASAYNPYTILVRPGVDLGERTWRPPGRGAAPRLVFAGAMFRRANVLAAVMLGRTVMPLVWRTLPDAELRIVGQRPTPAVRDLARADGRIAVTGEVPDLDVELLEADVVVAPSVLGGGILMKVLRAMALACPVITTPGPADSVGGDASNLFVAATSDEIADAVCAIVAAPDEAAARGRRAREHVGARFRWDDAVEGYLTAYALASRR